MQATTQREGPLASPEGGDVGKAGRRVDRIADEVDRPINKGRYAMRDEVKIDRSDIQRTMQKRPRHTLSDHFPEIQGIGGREGPSRVGAGVDAPP